VLLPAFVGDGLLVLDVLDLAVGAAEVDGSVTGTPLTCGLWAVDGWRFGPAEGAPGVEGAVGETMCRGLIAGRPAWSCAGDVLLCCAIDLADGR
jgi:hypothetical protein